jgi:hypothetical protein
MWEEITEEEKRNDRFCGNKLTELPKDAFPERHNK